MFKEFMFIRLFEICIKVITTKQYKRSSRIVKSMCHLWVIRIERHDLTKNWGFSIMHQLTIIAKSNINHSDTAKSACRGAQHCLTLNQVKLEYNTRNEWQLIMQLYYNTWNLNAIYSQWGTNSNHADCANAAVWLCNSGNLAQHLRSFCCRM